MALRLISPPAVEPLTLAEAKEHLRVDGNEEDALVWGLVVAARRTCEAFQNRAYVAQGWRLTADHFPVYYDGLWRFDGRTRRCRGPYSASGGVIELPPSPLLAVTSVTYADEAGVTQTLGAAEYVVDAQSEPGRVVPAYGKSWPPTRAQPNAVTVNFVTGCVTRFTVDAATNVFTATGRAPADGEVLQATNLGGTLPAPLAAATNYHVRDAGPGNTFKLAASAGGAAIDVTSAGDGTHFLGVIPEQVRLAMKLLVGHWYENRELAVIGTIVNALPMGVESLLWQDRVF